MKKYVLLFVSVAMLVVIVGFSGAGLDNKALTCLACEGEGEGGIVDKTPCEAFIVKIGFKNTGKAEGTWSVNIAFEGDAWTWSGTPQTLTLKPCKTRTLTWNGNVPGDAPVDSVSRLIAYYNDSFMPLDWWIHIVSAAELTITSSTVE